MVTCNQVVFYFYLRSFACISLHISSADKDNSVCFKGGKNQPIPVLGANTMRISSFTMRTEKCQVEHK